MNGRFRLGSWIIENWARMAPPFAVLASNLVFNGIGLLATIIAVYAIRRRGKPEGLPSVGDLI